MEPFMTFRYFAYGSNMLTERLKARCPSTKAIGRAFADGMAIEFSKRSKDGSGKATLSMKADCITPGVLFEIPKTERVKLDGHEGVGKGYERCDAFPVRPVDGDGTIIAFTYLATDMDSSLKPYEWYLALVIAGACEHGLGEAYLSSLRRIAYMPDPDDGRRALIEAMEALREAGIPEYRKLLHQG